MQGCSRGVLRVLKGLAGGWQGVGDGLKGGWRGIEGGEMWLKGVDGVEGG